MEMSNAFKTLRRHKLLFAVGLIVIVALVAILIYSQSAGEKLVAGGTLHISANSATDSFIYSGATVNQSMTLGCNVPASMKILCQSLANSGTITVYINDESYATGTVAGTGEVLLSSGCGCSTVCICEIKVGENTIKISSSNFAGELKYEIYVKS